MAQVLFQLCGIFLIALCQFRKMVVDFDVYHANWDPQKKTHIYLWLQNGSSWSSGLFGYLIASKTAALAKAS